MNNNYKHFFISINDISSSLTGERIKDRLPVWDRYVLRVPSFYLAYFLYNIIGLSANAVSVVSAIYAIILFVFVFYSPSNNIDIMLLMINIWPLLDCADGNIARSLAKKYNIKNVYGELYDAIAGWVVLGGLWITIGFYLTLSYANIIYLIIGAISTNAALISRLVNLRLILAENCNKKSGISSGNNLLYSLWWNVEVGAFMMPILFVSYLVGILHYMFIIYFIMNMLILVYSLSAVMMRSSPNIS